MEVICSFPTGRRWNDAVRKSSSAWRSHLEKHLLTVNSTKLVVKYEYLLTDLRTELKRMMEFLKFAYTEDDLQCTIDSTLEGFHRKHNKNVTDPYTPDQRNFVSEQIKLANNVLRHYNISY